MYELHLGDCLEVMKTMPDNSVDSIVTDPPYGIGFMGAHWDHGVPGVDFWREMLRVLDVGCHPVLRAGAGKRQQVRSRLEDAGFEIRDMIAWVYGSGMPKHRSHLKPALEPVTVARKKAAKATPLNIDACRISFGEETPYSYPNGRGGSGWHNIESLSTNLDVPIEGNPIGRYPANLIHDGSEEVVDLFPDSNGAGKSLPRVKITGYGDGAVGNGKSEYIGGERIPFDCGTGSAARFFYSTKASRKDRHEGLEDPDPQFKHGVTLRKIENTNTKGNNHPTVKPTELMRYLCRLVTPPGGVVLDPFMGSGSTGKAAHLEGFRFIGIEQDADYLEIARMRIAFVAGEDLL